MTVPHEDFIAKINAVRYAFLELGVEDGVILARTDSLGAGLTQKIPVSKVSQQNSSCTLSQRSFDLSKQSNISLGIIQVAYHDRCLEILPPSTTTSC